MVDSLKTCLMTRLYNTFGTTIALKNNAKSYTKKVFSILFILFLLFVANKNLTAQSASFTVNVSSGCTDLLVEFTNTSDLGGETFLAYQWDFDHGSSSTTTNPTHLYTSDGSFTVTLTLETFDGKYTATQVITVTETVSADLTATTTTACVNEVIGFQFDQTRKDGVKWDFGDGTLSTDADTYPMEHKYSAHGTYTVKYITFNGICSDTSETDITIEGPIANISIEPDSACIGDKIVFTATDTVDVNSFSWDVDEGSFTSTDSPLSYSYSTPQTKNITLTLVGTSRNCTLDETVYIYPVIAGIEYNTAICAINPINIVDASSGSNLSYYWNLGDGTTFDIRNPGFHSYESEGTYIITHAIENNIGCVDTIRDTITAVLPPTIELGEDWYICENDTAQLNASGGQAIQWSPSTGLDNPYSYTPFAFPSITTSYFVQITDTISDCQSSGIITVEVQNEPDWNSISLSPFPDTTVIIGDTAWIRTDTNNKYIYSWSPDYQAIGCMDCNELSVLPLVTTTYSLDLTDIRSCFNSTFDVEVIVREEYIVGVAEAFTPNDDHINDILYVDGWGIKDLIEFRIYNRWGKEVFFSDDINLGWDGYINGKQASIDSYAYYIKVEMWDDGVTTKNGTFVLIR